MAGNSNGEPAPSNSPFIPLAQAARETGSKANVLRKHRVNGWEQKGLAKKHQGNWYVDRAVLASIKAVRPRTGTKARRHEGTEGAAMHEDAELIRSAILRSSSPEAAMNAVRSQLTAEEVIELLKPLPEVPALSTVEGNELHVASAVKNLLDMRPIPWELVGRLVGFGLSIANVANQKTGTEKMP